MARRPPGSPRGPRARRLPEPPRNSEAGGERRGEEVQTPNRASSPSGPSRVGSGPAPASSRSPPAPTSVFPGEEASQLSAHGPVPRANPEARRRARRPPPPPAWTWPTPTSLPAALPLFPWQELAENHATHSSPLSGGNTSGLSRDSRGAGPWLLDPDARPPQALARPKPRAFLNNHHSPYQRSSREGGTNLSPASSGEQQGGGAPIRCPHSVDEETERIPAPELLGSPGPSRNVGE